jgi:hypothetical protein
MHTKPARSDAERIRAFREKLTQPSIVEIDDATAYWLEGENGRRIGEDSPTSEAPLLAALSEVGRGVDPLGLSLVCYVPDDGAPDDGRYVISSGLGLLEMAEWAAGLPPRPRVPAPRKMPGHNDGPVSRRVARGPAQPQGALSSKSRRPQGR